MAEIEEKEYIDPNDYKLAIFDLSKERKAILERRGFFPTSKGLIDDTYYRLIKDIGRIRHLKEELSFQQLLHMPYGKMENQLFMKDGVIAQPVTFYYDEPGWYDSFGGGREVHDVDPVCLEPFVARYVRAINRCGMETFYSCDGWHNKPSKSKELVILFSDRYSWMWHKLLYKESFIQEDNYWEHKHSGSDKIARIWLPRKDDEKLRVYDYILSAADTIVDKNRYFRELKEYVVHNIYGIDIDRLSDDEAEGKIEELIIRYKKVSN